MLPADETLLPLIQGMAEGDLDSLREFMEHVSGALHGAHLRATGQSVAAAVLTERSLEELWRTAPLYDPHYGAPRSWVMAVARLDAIAHVAKRRGREDRLKSRPDAAGQLAAGEGCCDPGARAALDKLDAADRQLLEDLWHKGVPGGSAGEELRAGLSRLLPLWADLLDEEAGA